MKHGFGLLEIRHRNSSRSIEMRHGLAISNESVCK
jgi:hypothetical protein